VEKAGVVLRDGWPPGVNPREQWQTYIYLLFSVLAADAQEEQVEQLRELARRQDGSRDALYAQAFTQPRHAFAQIQRRQLQARAAWQSYFRDYDAFLMPTAFVTAFPHDTRPPMQRTLSTANGERPYTDLDGWIAPATLAGLPATTAPIGLTESKLPVGLQIVGPYLEDATPIDVAAGIAYVVGGFTRPPGFA
jgi:amidase